MTGVITVWRRLALLSVLSLALLAPPDYAQSSTPAHNRLIKVLSFQANWLPSINPPWQSRVDTTEVVSTANAPQFSTSLLIHYPAGTVGPGENGVQFPLLFRRWQGMEDNFSNLSLAYCLKFKKGFDFGKGGKLPGLMGGDKSWTRSGGEQPDGTDGWTLRYMWRKGGEAVIYAYLPPSANGRYGNITWGQDIPLARTFIPGQWHCLRQRVTVNDIGQENGQLQVWFDGEQVLDLNDITYRTIDNSAGKIGGVYFSTFHGGHSPDWAPRHDSQLLINGLTLSR